jgi:hypothetical protein
VGKHRSFNLWSIRGRFEFAGVPRSFLWFPRNQSTHELGADETEVGGRRSEISQLRLELCRKLCRKLCREPRVRLAVQRDLVPPCRSWSDHRDGLSVNILLRIGTCWRVYGPLFDPEKVSMPVQAKPDYGNPKSETRNPKQIQSTKGEKFSKPRSCGWWNERLIFSGVRVQPRMHANGRE